jgi:carbon-monoxide dehydrogenase large subunit
MALRMSADRERTRAANSYVGSSIERIEDLRFLRGGGTYVDDVIRPGLLYAVILRSTVAHGRIRAIDGAAALARPGVRAVITAADIGAVPTIPLRQEQLAAFVPFEQPVIATGKVRYVGEPVAVVVAASPALAEDAAEAVAIDIEPLPVIADRAAAAGAEAGGTLLFKAVGSNIAGVLTAVKGDADAAFRTAAYVRREAFKVQRHTAVPMEPRGLVAEWDAVLGKLTLYGAAKVAFPNRRILAKQMGVAEAAIRMVENDVGGGFGVRGEFYPEDFLIPFAARFVGAPVKWTEDRREHFIAANHARDVACELEIACARDGRILALRGHAKADVGAYLRTNGATGARNTAQIIAGPYRVPNVRMQASVIVTNKTPVGTYRGPGRFEADFFRERLFDMAARDLGIDRIEFRRRNLIAEAEMPYELPRIMELDLATATDSGDYRTTLERCLAEIDWAGKVRLEGSAIAGRYHGLAVGCYLEGGASGPKETARLVLEADGSVSVYVGSSANGQGLETAFAQIAADALEMPIERVRIYHGSTDHVAEGFGTYSSRATVMGGSAIMAAAGKLREAIRAAAARRLTCDAKDIEIIPGTELGDRPLHRASAPSPRLRGEGRGEGQPQAQPRGGLPSPPRGGCPSPGLSPQAGRGEDCVARAPDGSSVPLAELARENISADGSYASQQRTYSYGAHAAHVAVDPRTGHVAVIDYVAVEDVGRIVNPAMLHGQTVGAIVQGLGGTLLEHLVHDEEAQLLTASLADYLMPTAPDFPAVRAVALEEKPAPHNPLGAKGAGEGGIIPVGGVVANAVAAALRPLGVEPRELPLSPSRLWQLMAAADASPRHGEPTGGRAEKSLAGAEGSDQDEPAHGGWRLK